MFGCRDKTKPQQTEKWQTNWRFSNYGMALKPWAEVQTGRMWFPGLCLKAQFLFFLILLWSAIPAWVCQQRQLEQLIFVSFLLKCFIKMLTQAFSSCATKRIPLLYSCGSAHIWEHTQKLGISLGSCSSWCHPLVFSCKGPLHWIFFY